MIGSSKNNRENYPRKCFKTQEQETRVKFNPRLSANRPSNSWAQDNCDNVDSQENQDNWTTWKSRITGLTGTTGTTATTRRTGTFNMIGFLTHMAIFLRGYLFIDIFF